MTHDPTTTQPPAPESLIVLRLPRAEKARYVAASRRAGGTLSAWIRATLSAASDAQAAQPGDARQDLTGGP